MYVLGRNNEWDKLELQWMGNEEERASFGINFQSNWNCFLCHSLALHLRRHYFCWKVPLLLHYCYSKPNSFSNSSISNRNLV